MVKNGKSKRYIGCVSRPPGYVKIAIENNHRKVNFPIKRGGSFHTCLLTLTRG